MPDDQHKSRHGTLEILGQPLEEEISVSPDIQAVLGRPSSSYEAWVARHVDAFR